MTFYPARLVCIAGALCLAMVGTLTTHSANAADVTINVVDGQSTAIDGFKYLIQEDRTFDVDPANPATSPDELLATSFHRSYHPIAKRSDGSALTGESDGSSINVAGLEPGRYFVSILPYSDHSIGGIPVRIESVGDSITTDIVAHAHPIPTAQIAVYLFQDKFPINGAPDLPEELNPDVGVQGHVDWTEFSIFLEEPAGRYGVAGGQVIQDVFGNPIGTTYQRTLGGNPVYDVDGDPVVEAMGDGTITPRADGSLHIRNIAPGKYGIVVIPPTDSNWQQTSTIEGSKVIDAWVKANEPPAFIEFGPPGPHVFVGFVKSTDDGGFPVLAGSTTVSGSVVDNHNSRPPATQFFDGRSFPDCWVGLNDATVGIGQGVYAAPCADDSSFSIPAVPAGSYQLKVFDKNLDLIISTFAFTVDGGGTCNNGNSCNFGTVPVFNWFSRINAGVFNDADQDGFWDQDDPQTPEDESELGIGPESQEVVLRWRDGTVYQAFPTDNDGLAPFDEMFPFFHWLVAEVSFGNKKATGATFVVDAGGAIPTGDSFPGFAELNPQEQCVEDTAPGARPGSTVGHTGLNDCPPGSEEINDNTGDNLSKTQTGQVLTTGVQGFLGQTSVMHFGKTDYVNFTQPHTDGNGFHPPEFVGENGGISGIVYYATTRAEDEPQFAAAEEWEPGVPRVQIALYADGDIDCYPLGNFPADDCDIDWNNNGSLDLDDGFIDDVNGNQLGAPVTSHVQVDYADVDNFPFGDFPGPGDVDHNANSAFDYGDAIAVTTTDSWDDSLPTGCQGPALEFAANPNSAPMPVDCLDGLASFNQIRDAVFDGGYAFNGYDLAELPVAIQNKLNAFYALPRVLAIESGDPDAPGFRGLIPGEYIVSASTPPGYETLREEHKNVDFGDSYEPDVTPQALPVACVGEMHTVPRYLQMQTVADPGQIDGRRAIVATEDLVDAPFSGEQRALCDTKKVPLSGGQNAAAEFWVMTDVPITGNTSGIVLNDLANEFDPSNPNFGEKYAPPLLPVGFYDWQGNLVNRVYTDQYGRYNLVVPSTYTTNLPQPSGMSPNMMISCMNDAGEIPNPDYDPLNPEFASEFVPDPFFDSQYSQFCYTFQYMPGAITYLDTPVVSVGAFAGSGARPVDCARPTKTPMVSSVFRRRPHVNSWTTDNPVGGLLNAVLPRHQKGPFALPGEEIVIRSQGFRTVINPEWDGIDLAKKNIRRNFGFGTSGTLGKAWVVDGSGVETDLGIVNWHNGRIRASVPAALVPGEYQVMVTRSDNGVSSPIGVTLTVGVRTQSTPILGQMVELGRDLNGDYAIHNVPSEFPTIQAAIDASANGDLVMVENGVYDELVIMWKPVRLQGWGAGEVSIIARQAPTEKIFDWREKAQQLVQFSDIDLLPGQGLGNVGGFPGLADVTFPTEEGAGIFVAGIRDNPNSTIEDPFLFKNNGARIDGFTVKGASTGGGISVNGYAEGLQISNNEVSANSGFYGGGIRVGHPQSVTEDVNGDTSYDDAQNYGLQIKYNHVVQNGSIGGQGGGISLYTGSNNYDVSNNWVCGNFSQGDGAGIAHAGFSDGGVIANNQVIFNESFSQMNPASGGGIAVTGLAPLQNFAPTLSPGTGSVTIDSNTIRGNLAGAGDGGGLRIQSANGHDIANDPASSVAWSMISVTNNMVTNNVAGLAGGSISVEDSVLVTIDNNTLANNDSTATTALAFSPGVANVSNPQPAGVVSRAHGSGMQAVMATVTAASPTDSDWLVFSDPLLRENIIYQNRAYHWENNDDPNTPEIEHGLVLDVCGLGGVSCDLAVLDNPTNVGNNVGPALLDPRNSVLTDITGYDASNVVGDPAFLRAYQNDARNGLIFGEQAGLQSAIAFDEGGNFIQVQFSPLSIVEYAYDENVEPYVLIDNNTTLYDYHLDVGSAAIDVGSSVTGPASDIDGDTRPIGVEDDAGADEAQ